MIDDDQELPVPSAVSVLRENVLGPGSAMEKSSGSQWTFFSNHGHILLALAEDPNARLRDLADRVGITERAVHRLLAEMEEAGVISRRRDGRRNTYSIRRSARLRHPIESHCCVGDLIDLIQGARPKRRTA